MNIKQLESHLKAIGLNVIEEAEGVFKGHSCNVRRRHVFRIWINTRGRVAIKTRGIQKSFEIRNVNDLKRELKGFEIV